MSACKRCNATIQWAINLNTTSLIPLVPFEEGYADRFRYALTGIRDNGQRECERDDEGDMMSHFANCPNAKQFSGRNKK